jgi:hypothetical protein
VVGKRNVFKQRVSDVFVESRPAAVFTLEAQQPPERPLVKRRIFFVPGGLQREQHHGRIVGIRVMRVVEFEAPAGRLRAGISHRPVARDAHFLRHEPANGTLDRFFSDA